MKHFLIFLAFVFSGLFMAVLKKTDKANYSTSTPVVRIFGYSSFTGSWGAGPALKELFEKTCNCKVEFIEGSDSGILLQRLKIEGENLGADLVVGLDQFDLSKAAAEITWRKIKISEIDTYNHLKLVLGNGYFVPYDWGLLTFITRKNEFPVLPESLKDLLASEYSKKIALQDPRTSSPGMQFLTWVLKSYGEEEGFEFTRKMMGQAHSFSPSWSSSYGLFTNRQAGMVYSYVTSPLYHRIEEKNDGYIAVDLKEAMSVQYEFVGIPEMCRHCELSEKFINLMLSAEGQKILMTKNYMFPVLKGVAEGTDFEPLMKLDQIDEFKVMPVEEVESLLKRWTEIRRGSRS